MRRDMPLAKKKVIELSDLKGQPLIIPRQPNHNTHISELLVKSTGGEMYIAAEYNLAYKRSAIDRRSDSECQSYLLKKKPPAE